MATPDGANVIGQPEVAASWYPVNDHPIDKASYSFDVTVPDGYEVVANGFLRDRDHHRGWTTWEWEAREPMASYLATIDIGYWDVHRWRTDSGIPVYDAVDSAITGGLRQEIDSSLARQGEILDLLSDAFGPYPFNTVGAIVDNQDDLFFALETQTRPVYSKLFWLDSEGNQQRRLRRRPRAGPPVVRGRRRARALEGHLAQRGVRDVRRVALGGVRGPRHSPGDFPGELRRHSRG